MDILWSPWRYAYIKGGDVTPKRAADCVFCELLADERTDDEKFILFRGEFNFVILNIYPYISGHLMIIPFGHVGELDAAEKRVTDEMMDLSKFSQTVLRDVYQPHGFNLGMNLGQAAGAGVAAHIHLHLMPRWFGDANFTTTISETRVLPETLNETFRKLYPRFQS